MPFIYMRKKKTRGGIFKDLRDSYYIFSFEDIKLVFSGEYALKRFCKYLPEEYERIRNSLEKRFSFELDPFYLAILITYRRTQTRGILIIVDGKEITSWHGLTISDGLKTI